MAYSQYFKGPFVAKEPSAAITYITPPTFGGITGLVANSNGSLTASWSAATTGGPNPLSYLVYIQAATATGLFSGSNLRLITRSLSTAIFTDALGAVLSQGTVYYVGVRAFDAVGNTETNVVSLNATSQGVPATSTNNLLNQLIATIGTPAGASVSADIAQVEANVLVLENGVSVQMDVLQQMHLPVSGTKIYPLRIRFVNNLGINVDPDSNSVNISILDTAGGTVLASTAMSRQSVGVYRYDYSVATADAARVLLAQFDFTYLSVAMTRRQETETVKDTQNLNSIITTIGTPTLATVSADINARPTNPLLTNDSRLNNLDATISSRAATADTRFANLDATISSRAATADSRFTNLDATISSRAATADARFANLDAAVSSRATQASVSAIPTNPLLTSDVRLNHLDADVSSRATQTSVDNVQLTVNSIQGQNVDSVIILPQNISIPETGTETYRIFFKNAKMGVPADVAYGPFIEITQQDGMTDIVASVAMSHSSTGVYYYDYVVAAAAYDGGILIKVTHKDMVTDPLDTTIQAGYQSKVNMGIDKISSDTQTLVSRLTAQRAVNLDHLDADISSRVAAADSRLAHLDADISSRVATADSRIAHLDADISSRSTQTSVDARPTNPLLTNDSRLNHLDVDISSRASQSSVDAIPTNPLVTTDSRIAHLDADISSRASQTSMDARPTNPLLTTDSRLSHLDVDISSRVATADPRIAHLDVDVSSRASQQSLDDDFGNVSTLVGNLQTTSSDLQTTSANIANTESALAADLLTLSSQLSDFANSNSQYASMLLDMASKLTDFANKLTHFDGDLTQLDSDILALEAQVGILVGLNLGELTTLADTLKRALLAVTNKGTITTHRITGIVYE